MFNSGPLVSVNVTCRANLLGEEMIFASSELVSPESVIPELVHNRGGVCLRGGRVKEDMTQIQLASLTGISPRHISEMENGKRPIDIATAKKLAEILKIDHRVFL